MYLTPNKTASMDLRLLQARFIRLLVEGALLDGSGETGGTISAYVDTELPRE
jgi:hypothetical protein